MTTMNPITAAPIATKTNCVDETTDTTPPVPTSYLNNDNIDSMKPESKEPVSSISLSDQLVDSFPSMSAFAKQAAADVSQREKSLSNALSPHRFSFSSNLLSKPPQFKKDIIDHPRVASYAFAFDIDGVLVRGPETLSHGVEAIKYLDGENPYNIKVPYIFVTNGGGKHESVRAQDLSKRLQTEITCNQIVQGHTPMKELAGTYKNVLVVGGIGNTCRHVAKDYGFENVFTPHDIMRWDPSVTPYYEMSEEDLGYCECDEDVDFSKTPIDAIMVFADSRNWAADQQIILELLMSKGGYMGTISDTFEDGPPIYFAHSDFVWATNYRLVRYGMGALQVSIAALFKEHTGKELNVIRFGKPQRTTFKFAEKVLDSWRKDILEDHIEEMTSCADSTTFTSDIFSSPDDSKYKSVFPSSDSETDDRESEDDENIDGLTIQSLNKLRLAEGNTAGSPDTTAATAAAVAAVEGATSTPTAGSVTGTKPRTLSCPDDLPPPSTVYFVGDTPESDIRFANSHDESWFSILVNTGVYQSETTPKYKPKKQCDNVFEAVKFAVEREHQKELEEWNKNAIDPQAY